MTKTQTTKTEAATVQCNCGCGEATQSAKSLYRPGHDARHAGLVARDLVASRLRGHERQYSEEDLGSDALRAKALKMTDRLTAKAQAQADRAAAKNAPQVDSIWKADGTVKIGRWTYEVQKDQHNNRRRNENTKGTGGWVAC